MSTWEEEDKELDHKQKFEKEQLEADDLQNASWFKIFMTCVWVAATAVMIYYLILIVDQYHSSKANPSSTILFIEKNRLPMPQIVICNWNQDGNLTHPLPTGDCDICNLTLESCAYNLTTDCASEWIRHDFQTSGGLFTCYQYNSDASNPEYSNTTGYSGSIATVWSVPLADREDPPVNRVGVQVTFAPVGQITAQDIYNEVNFASMGLDTFFALTYINTLHNELSKKDPAYNLSHFETASSTVTLLQSFDTENSNNATIGYIALSFSYQTLSLQEVSFDIAYNLNNLFGDFAGMLGTLMGLDVIKLAAGLPMGYLAWKYKTWKPFQEAFNG